MYFLESVVDLIFQISNASVYEEEGKKVKMKETN